MDVEVTRVSSKGQVVIPSSLRDSLGIRSSDRFLVFGEGDTLVLQRLSPAALRKSFRQLSAPLARRARALGILREEDVERVVREFRRRP